MKNDWNKVEERYKTYIGAKRDEFWIKIGTLFIPLDLIVNLYFKESFSKLFGSFGLGLLNAASAFGLLFGLIYLFVYFKTGELPSSEAKRLWQVVG